MSTTPSITEDQVLAGIAAARGAILRWAPESISDRAVQVADRIASNPALTKAVAYLGGEGLARANAWWSSVSPFAEVPAVDQRDGVAHGIAEIRGAAASMMTRRDAEIIAFSEFTQALMEIGWDGVKFALPLIIAALPKSQ